jgi:hypothetical protein
MDRGGDRSSVGKLETYFEHLAKLVKMIQDGWIPFFGELRLKS